MKVKLTKEEKKEQREKKREARKQRIKNLRSKDQKSKVEKAYRPPGYIARKIGATVFWMLFVFMFLVVGINVIQPSSSATESTSDEVEEQPENMATKPEAIQFAENFTKNYFTWGVEDEDKENRQERLTPYLAKGVDSQAGLNLDSIQFNSELETIEISKVEEVDENKSIITFRVEHVLTDGTTTKKSKKAETTTEEKFFAVPIGYKNGYGVYNLPKFTYVTNETELEKEEIEGKSVADNAIEDNIKDFLPTFFSSYAADPKDKLVYVLADPNVSDGLNGTMEFVEVETPKIYQGETEGNYAVAVDVIFQDPATETQFTTAYDLELNEREGRFVVTAINEGN